MGKLIFRGVSRQVSRLKGFRKESMRLANEKFLEEKENLLKDFNKHPVTREIESGPDASNVSGTLPGGYGNLFSFIGFNSGENPTEIVRDALEATRLNKTPKKKISLDKASYSFTVKYPTLEILKQATPMPWETGLSWLAKVEQGISGFGYFMSSLNSGRSRGGVQTDRKIRQGGYSPVSYYSGIINRFKKRMKKK